MLAYFVAILPRLLDLPANYGVTIMRISVLMMPGLIAALMFGIPLYVLFKLILATV